MTADGNRILIVYDEPGMLLVLKYALETAGCEVTTCDTVEAARKILETTRFRLVISDLYLSRKKEPVGFDILTCIKGSQSHGSTDVIIITGDGSDEIRAEVFARGASDYHEKQAGIKDLLDKIGLLGIPTRFG